MKTLNTLTVWTKTKLFLGLQNHHKDDAQYPDIYSEDLIMI